jgi:hypothetical protein
MKTPRLTDFDPDAKAPPLKSSLDDMPTIQKPQPTTNVQSPPPLSVKYDSENSHQHTTAQPVPRPVPRPVPGTPYPVPRKRRMRQRQPFDIYEDQYESLKQAAEEDRELGLPGSMSALVRRGIDLALEERKRERP